MCGQLFMLACSPLTRILCFGSPQMAVHIVRFSADFALVCVRPKWAQSLISCGVFFTQLDESLSAAESLRNTDFECGNERSTSERGL